MSPTTLMSLCKFRVQLFYKGAVDLVSELVDLHSDRVDPKALKVAIASFQSQVPGPNLRQCPFTRLYVVVTQYTRDNKSSSWWTFCVSVLGTGAYPRPLQKTGRS